jgi:hypothetical protein
VVPARVLKIITVRTTIVVGYSSEVKILYLRVTQKPISYCYGYCVPFVLDVKSSPLAKQLIYPLQQIPTVNIV